MSALRGRLPSRRGPDPRHGWRPRAAPGGGLRPDWPWYDGYILNFPAFSARLSSFLEAHSGRWPDHILTGLILSKCLPHWLSDNLADLYQYGELESPENVHELSGQIFEASRDPKRSLDHIVKHIEGWDPAPSGDDEADSNLADKFLDLYELAVYYQIDEAFLSFKVLEAFASKVTTDMLGEWHSFIGDDVTDENLPELVLQFLRTRPRRIYSYPDRGKSPDRSENIVTPEEAEREAGVVAHKITCEMQHQATVAHLLPLINSGRCKRDLPERKEKFCVKNCDDPLLHPLEECEYFLGLSVPRRRDLCRTGKRCYKCLCKGHGSTDCPSSVVEEIHPLISYQVDKPPPIYAGCASTASTNTGSPVMVPAQVILDPAGVQYTVMFDTGSQITLITKDCAIKLGAKEIGESTLVILGIGNGRALPYKIYELTLPTISGESVTFRAHSVNELKIEVSNYDSSVVKETFPEINVDELVQPKGYIHLLVGSDNAHLMPKEKSRKDKMILYESVLKGCSGLVIAGQAGCHSYPVFAAAAVGHFDPADFLSAEALGTDLPRQCRSCKSCKECQFRTSVLSAKENMEYEVIRNNLTFDSEKQKWTTSYPFVTSPTVLQNNYSQAVACMKSLEAKLKKQNRLAEFNDAFKDIVDRGVFKELSSQAIDDWKGPINYISIVCAYKSGPHQSTPLRLCMNSIMKQPQPVGKS